MSDDLYGQAGLEAEAGFSPMPLPKDGEADTYGSDTDSLRKAASDYSETKEAPVVERSYEWKGGDHSGEQIEPTKTIDAARAARELTQARNAEDFDANLNWAREMADATDNLRAQSTPQTPAPADELPAQNDAAPTPPHVEGIDPDVAEALKNPKVRAAVEAEVTQLEKAREAFNGAAEAATRVGLAALLSNFPELSGLSGDQLPAAMQVMAASNPERHAQVKAHLQHVEQLYIASEQAKAAQQSQFNDRFSQYAKQQDSMFDESIKSDSPETIKAVKADLVEIAKTDYGIPPETFVQLWNTQPIMRSAAFQRVMYDAVKYRQALKGAQKAPSRPVPPVQRPGVSQDRSASSSDVEAFRADFSKNPNPKTAAALLRAKRAAV